MLLSFSLFFVFLAGCQVDTLPTITPVIPVASTTVVSAAATKHATTQVLSTATPSATINSHFEELPLTKTPTLTPFTTRHLTPTPTPDLNVEIAWSDKVGLVGESPGSSLLWSPNSNSFLSIFCPPHSNTTQSIFLVKAPEFHLIDVAPNELWCYSVNVLWHPSGDYFLISGKMLDELNYGWQIDFNSFTSIELGETSSYWGWLNDQLTISQSRVGTGINGIGIDNVVTGEEIAGTMFDGFVVGTSNEYVVLYADYLHFVAVLAQEVINPELAGTPISYYVHVKSLSTKFGETEPIYQGRSSFADVVPNSDQILVLTWGTDSDPDLDPYYDPEVLILGELSTDLQLWDVTNDELLTVVPGGIYGRFAPDGSTFLSMTPGETYPTLQLEKWNTREPIFQLPVYPEVGLTSFSPDSRYVTFFTPAFLTLDAAGQITTLELSADETYLTVYDQEVRRFLPQVAANPKVPVWSPVSNRFAFWNAVNEMLLYDVAANTVYPIAETGGDHLNNPQWSFDGAYLSLNLYPYPCYPDCHFVILEMR